MQASIRPPNALRQLAPQPDRQPWSILVLLGIAEFMVIVDMTVVNIALPSIGRALRFATAADLQWVVTIYVLFSGGLQLLGGRTADLLGRRRMFLLGLLIFTTASFGSGLAPNPGWLMVSRAAQGLGAAVLAPAALSIITSVYTGSQRTAALGIWGALGGAGAAAGVLLGGLLTSSLGWPAIFFINVPIGALTGAFAVRLVPVIPRSRHAGEDGLDIAGAFTVVAGPVLLVYAITTSATAGWTSLRVLIPLALAGALLFLFVIIERVVRRPLIPPAIWRVRSLVSSAVAMLGATAVLAGGFFLNSLYLQRVLGASPLAAGLAFLPFTIAIALAAHIGSRLLARLGTRLLATTGLLLASVGILIWAAPSQASYVTNLLPGFLALGIGLGFTLVSISVAAMADIKADETGLASGLMISGHELGAALGVAVLSGVMTAVMSGVTTAASFANGYRASLVIAAILAAALALLAFLTMPAVRPTPGTQVRVH